MVRSDTGYDIGGYRPGDYCLGDADDYGAEYGEDYVVCDATLAERLPTQVRARWPFRAPQPDSADEDDEENQSAEPSADDTPAKTTRKPRKPRISAAAKRDLDKLSDHAANFAAAHAVIPLRVMTEDDRLDIMTAISGGDATIAAGFAVVEPNGPPARSLTGGPPVFYGRDYGAHRQHWLVRSALSATKIPGFTSGAQDDIGAADSTGSITPALPTMMVYSRRCKVKRLAGELARYAALMAGSGLSRTVTGALVAIDDNGRPTDHADFGGDAFIVHDCLDCPHGLGVPEDFDFSEYRFENELRRQLQEELLRYLMWAAARRESRKVAEHQRGPWGDVPF